MIDIHPTKCNICGGIVSIVEQKWMLKANKER